MRVLVASTAGSGHFGPLVPVARACADAGHEVAVAAPESFADEVVAAGLAHRPFADVPGELMAPVMARLPSLPRAEANRTVIGEVFGRLDARAALPGVAAIIEEWRPDLVIREPAELGSLAAALAAGVPQAVVAVGVAEMTERMAAVLPEPLAELDTLAGLPGGACAAAFGGATTLTTVPAVLDGARRGDGGALHRYREPRPATDGHLPEPWGDPEQPLVYVTFGSVAARIPHFASIYPAVLAALSVLPLRVLLTTGSGLAVDALDVPQNTCVRQWWPQADVLQHASAVVGHGGFGTTMAALAAGVPQVVLPLFAMDQFINAGRVAAVGAGTALEGPDAVPDLSDAVAGVLADERYRVAAEAVADAMAGLPPVASVVALLEELARGDGRGR